MSATMPQRVLQHLQKEPHELVNLSGLPYGLRIVTVTCNRDEWLDVSKSIIKGMRRPGHSSLMFVNSGDECDAYEAEGRREYEDMHSQDAHYHAGRQLMNLSAIPVHGRDNRALSDDSLTSPLESNECRTFVATDKLGASNTLPSLFCVVNPGIAKRPSHRAEVHFVALSLLSPAENRQRQGRGGRTQASIVFQLTFRGMCNLAPNEEDTFDKPRKNKPRNVTMHRFVAYCVELSTIHMWHVADSLHNVRETSHVAKSHISMIRLHYRHHAIGSSPSPILFKISSAAPKDPSKPISPAKQIITRHLCSAE